MFRNQLSAHWAPLTRDGLVMYFIYFVGADIRWLERIGGFYLLILVLGIATACIIRVIAALRSEFAREVWTQANNRPWMKRNREGFAIERVGLLSAAILVASTLLSRDLLNANLYGIAICNLVVALAVRYGVSAAQALKQEHRLRTNQASPEEIVNTFKSDRIFPALERAIGVGALAATALTHQALKPELLAEWWMMFLIVGFATISVGKMYTIWQPLDLWHMLTKHEFRDVTQRKDTPVSYREGTEELTHKFVDTPLHTTN